MVFQNGPEDPNSLGSNFVECLHEYDGTLWVGTDSGLFRYRAEYQNFELLEASINRPILDIEHDDEGNLWYIAGTTLFKHSLATGETHGFDTETYFHAEEITRTENGGIWAANDIFLLAYDPKNDSFKTIEPSKH